MARRSLGRRAQWVYEALHARIASGEWPPGTQLPSQPQMAAQLGVAIMTLRAALAALAADGLVTAQHGRGTYVRRSTPAAILVVDDEAAVRGLLRTILRPTGYAIREAGEPARALILLESDPSIAVVLTDLAMPTTDVGVDFIRSVRRRWPALPVIALTAFPDDLAALHGTPECPVLVVSKPFHRRQIAEALHLALAGGTTGSAWPGPATPERAPVLVADDDPEVRAVVSAAIRAQGYEVVEVGSGSAAWQALAHRYFGHVFFDLRMPEGGAEQVAAIADAHPATTVVACTAYPGDLLPQQGTYTVLPKPFTLAGLRASLELNRRPLTT